MKTNVVRQDSDVGASMRILKRVWEWYLRVSAGPSQEEYAKSAGWVPDPTRTFLVCMGLTIAFLWGFWLYVHW